MRRTALRSSSAKWASSWLYATSGASDRGELGCEGSLSPPERQALIRARVMNGKGVDSGVTA
ncbi:hypothetical protein [Nocardia sp. CS682]|uniref:hypothetical protein n=1 Tax=Nocardia sp. CS682 TaxID=1047172 RepID=UPI001074B0D4|nr:hypothetical protein [Nocardia sp. CS682]